MENVVLVYLITGCYGNSTPT